MAKKLSLNTKTEAYWLVKSEPDKYSWEKFNQEGRTFWDGVRNFQARNNLKAMKQATRCCITTVMKAKQLSA